MWPQEDEENILFTKNKVPSFFPFSPPTPSFNIDGLTSASSSGIADSIDRFGKQTLGLGIIGVGAAVLVGTRGAGFKPASIIMSTGLNVLAEAYE